MSRKGLPEHMRRLIAEQRELAELKCVWAIVPGVSMSVMVLGAPRPWSRARVGEDGSHYTPQKCRDAKREFAKVAAAQRPGCWPMQAAFSLDVLCCFTGAAPADWDNLGKLPSDAFNKVLWNDDRQVLEGRVRKVPFHHQALTTLVVTVLGPMPARKTA